MTQPTVTLTEEQRKRFNEAWDYVEKYNLWSEYYGWFTWEHPDTHVTESVMIQTITEFAVMKGALKDV